MTVRESIDKLYEIEDKNALVWGRKFTIDRDEPRFALIDNDTGVYVSEEGDCVIPFL